MMKENFEKLKKSSEDYILNNSNNLTKDVLEYIKIRIEQNKNEIKELIDLKKENITYEEIYNVIEEEMEEDNNYKDYSKLAINKENFLAFSMKMPIGIIAVEAFDTKEVIKYYIKAVVTRNAIAISDIEYDEDNVKFLILLIIKEALKKFEISEDLIMLLPYEECFYEYFDEVIYTYDEKGNLLETPKIEKKQYTNKTYVYLDDLEFEEDAKSNENSEILTGEIEEVIRKVNMSKGIVMYTKNKEKAYKFINLVHAQNAFVNTNLSNMYDTKIIKNKYFEYRNIIIPIPSTREEEVISVKKEDN